MKSILKIVVLIILFGNMGCQKEDVEDEIFQVEVIGKGIDCGDIFLIKFQEEDENRVGKYLERTNAFFPVFYADNLIEEHKEEGLFLTITLRKCSLEDSYACTMLGPTYSHVCVKSSETISLTFPL